MDEYVYKNLERYGNCYITYDAYKRKRRSRILKDLEKHGFICEIRIEDDHYSDTPGEKDVIIDVIKKVNNG